MASPSASYIRPTKQSNRMEEIDKILKAIGEVYRLSDDCILKGGTKNAVEARMVLCHIIRNNRYGLVRYMAANVGMPFAEIKKADERLVEIMEGGNCNYIRRVNKVRKLLRLSPVYLDVEMESERARKTAERNLRTMQSARQSRRLFGITYTPEEEAGIKGIMRASAEYMDKEFGHSPHIPMRCY